MRGVREGGIEALTGAEAGRVLSCEIIAIGVPTLFSKAEGHTRGAVSRVVARPGAVGDPGMHGNSAHENRETSAMPASDVGRGRWGRP